MTEEFADLFALHGMPQHDIDEISSNFSSFHEKFRRSRSKSKSFILRLERRLCLAVRSGSC